MLEALWDLIDQCVLDLLGPWGLGGTRSITSISHRTGFGL